MPGWARLAVAGAGLAIAVLSLAPAWLVHVRNVGGHGLTAITVTWSAWEGRAWPFLPVAVLVAAAAALLAIVGLRRPALAPRALLAAASVLVLALLLGNLRPRPGGGPDR